MGEAVRTAAAAAAVAGIGARGESAGAAGTRLATAASVGTLDDVVRAGKRLEVVAGGGQVLRRLQVESTLDVLERGQRDAAMD